MTRRLPVRAGAFTLIELIGVLAIIAVLAAVLVPKVFEAIHNARLGAVPLGLNTVKTATLEHFVRYDTLASNKGAPLVFSGTYDDFDLILVAEGLMDKPFTVRVGTNATIRLVDVAGLDADSDPLDSNKPGAYDLDGDGDNDVVGAKYLLEAVIDGPERADVIGINDIMDGPTMGPTGSDTEDRKGRVVYQASGDNDPNPHANPNARKRRPGTMYIYIGRR